MKKSFAFFDFDGTLSRGDSVIPFVFFAYHRRECDFHHLLKCARACLLWKMGLMTDEQSKCIAVSFLNGKPEAQRHKLAMDFCRECLQKNLFAQGLTELRQRKAQGDTVVIVSASFSFYMKEIMEYLPADRLLATEYDFEQGCLMGDNCKGEAKVMRIRQMLAESSEELDTENSSAYGDSLSDAPMLRLCKHKYGINAKKALKRALSGEAAAKFVNWE